MPIVSKAQRGYLWANDPEVAQKLEDKTPKGKKLPDHVKRHGRKVDNTLQPPLVLNTGSPGIRCEVTNMVTTLPVSDNPKPSGGKRVEWEGHKAGKDKACPECGARVKNGKCTNCDWANP